MTPPTNNQRIKRTIAAHFAQEMPELTKNPELDEDTHLANDLGADSLDRLELIMAVETEMRVEIPTEWEEGITTVRHLLSADNCSHASKGVGCPKTACHSCKYLMRHAA